MLSCRHLTGLPLVVTLPSSSFTHACQPPGRQDACGFVSRLQAALRTLANTPVAAATSPPPLPDAPLHPLLDRVLRRCPLLPAEVDRIEQQLQYQLHSSATPEDIAAQLVAQLQRCPASRQRRVHRQILEVLQRPDPAPACSWTTECRRIVHTVVAELCRLQGNRTVGMALYAVTNRMLGDQGVQALSWAQHTRAVAALLTQEAWLPWLDWLCQLPLPSLREGRWLEPLLAALPDALHRACAATAAVHEALHAELSPTHAPLRWLLLATAWLLWTRQASPAPPAPATWPGQQCAALPQAAQRLDGVGQAARRLFAAPTCSDQNCSASTLLPLTSAALTALAVVRRGNAGVGAPGVAAAWMASMGQARATDEGGTLAVADDRVTLIDALWTLHDTTPGNATINLDARAVSAAPGGLHAHRLQVVREILLQLYQQDAFMGTLYVERVPPCTLRVDNATLTGRRVVSNAPVQLNPPLEQENAARWSPATAALLQELQTAVDRAGFCYDNSRVPLRCALQFHLEQHLHERNATVPALASLIQQLEQRLPEDATTAAEQEAGTLLRLRQDMVWAKAQPLRGLEPSWRNWRPDPRSHLGNNLALARRVVRQLSEHPVLIQLCAGLGADAHHLVFPEKGTVLARAWGGDGWVVLFPAQAPPAALAPLASALRGLAALLRAPVRTDGVMRVPELLAYYQIPWPGTAQDDGPFDAAIAALDQRLGSLKPPPGAPGAMAPRTLIDAPRPQPERQAVIDALWQAFDHANASTLLDLSTLSFPAASDSALHRLWLQAQQRLQQLFEAPALWLALRDADASFTSLRVAADHVLAADRQDARLLRINATGSALQALQTLAARLGCVAPTGPLPLSAALAFHGVTAPAAASPCHPTAPLQRLELLPLLAQLQAHRPHGATEDPLYAQALGDLRDARRWLQGVQNGSEPAGRPSLGSAAAPAVYEALGRFATLLAHPQVNATMLDLRESLRVAKLDVGGMFSARFDDGARMWLNATEEWSATPALDAALKALQESARVLRGPVRSDGRVAPAQLLARHGGCAPQETTQTGGLLRCAERVLGELRLGMRPHLVHAQDLLGPAELTAVRHATRGYLAGCTDTDITLLEYLGAPLVADGTFAWHQLERLNYALSEMARTPPAQALQDVLLEALDWHGRNRTGPTSPTLLSSLTVQAIVADLGPPSNREQRIVLGYRLHKQANRGRTFGEIRDDFSAYLLSLGRLPQALHGMAVQLVLQEEAPELLGQDIPPHLVFGSAIAAVEYASGVHLAHRIQRGLWAQMNFSALVTLSTEVSVDREVPTEVRQVALDARRLPTLDWWIFRDLDAQEAAPANLTARIDTALARFDQRVRQIDTAITDLLAPPPYRMPMVEAELKRVFPQFPGVFATLAWNSTEMRLCNDRAWFGYSFPLFELYAAGALEQAREDWHPCRYYVPDTPLSRAQDHRQHALQHNQTHAALQHGFAQLDNVARRFQQAFDDYFSKARRGYGVLIEEALYLRPEPERRAIARGEVQIYTLRTHVDLEAQQETPADTAPYRGRFGVIYCIAPEGQQRCFQLFPLQSRILPLDLQGALPVGGQLETRRVRLRHGRWATVQVRRGTPLDVDWQAYASYQVPVSGRQSVVIVERLLSNASAATLPSGALRSPFHALVAPLQADFFWLDAVAFHYEASAPTTFEAQLKDAPLWLKAVEFVIPFVSNLRRMSSADRDEFALAAFGLYLEGVLIAWPLSSSVFKVLARPGPRMTRPRFQELAGALGRGTLDAFNPLAGAVTVVRLGVGVVQHGLGGGLQFVWSRLQRPRLYPGRWNWVMRSGMAVLRGGPMPDIQPLRLSLRTVHDFSDVLVVAQPGAPSQRTFHLLDPATLTPYGPALRPHLESSNAAGVLFKVGEGLRVKPSAGKALKPMKQGSKASQETSGETLGIPLPPTLDLPAPLSRRTLP